MNVIERMTVRQSVSACKACDLHKVARQPIPFRGSSEPTIAIIGEAPGRTEDALGKVFVGRSGELLDELLAGVGIEASEVAILNTVSCFPNRTPTSREVEICSGNVDRMLRHLAPPYILALGGIANSRWWSDIRMGDLRGRFYAISDPVPAWVTSTWHPAAILRNPSLGEDARRDLRRLRRVVLTEGRDPLAIDGGAIGYPFEGNCFLCGEFGDQWIWANGTTPDREDERVGKGGLALCQKHYDRRMGLGGGGRTKKTKEPRKPTNQEGMF